MSTRVSIRLLATIRISWSSLEDDLFKTAYSKSGCTAMPYEFVNPEDNCDRRTEPTIFAVNVQGVVVHTSNLTFSSPEGKHCCKASLIPDLSLASKEKDT